MWYLTEIDCNFTTPEALWLCTVKLSYGNNATMTILQSNLRSVLGNYVNFATAHVGQKNRQQLLTLKLTTTFAVLQPSQCMLVSPKTHWKSKHVFMSQIAQNSWKVWNVFIEISVWLVVANSFDPHLPILVDNAHAPSSLHPGLCRLLGLADLDNPRQICETLHTVTVCVRLQGSI